MTRRSGLLLGALLVASVLAAYAGALRAGYVWDDDAHVTQNETLRGPQGLRRIWLDPRALPQYYPLVHTTFWIEHRLWGIRPAGYHLVNVLLHAANALLLVALLRRLAVPGAWLAGFLFALHPVHVESVAWITERKNVLSTFFYLAAAAFFLDYFRVAPRVRRRRPATAYALGFVLFLCALFSKTVTCSLPAAFLLILWWKRGRVTRGEALALTPLFGVGGSFALLTAWLERYHVGASGEAWSLSFLERFLVAGRALWFYAAKLVWPRNLTFNYPRWNVDSSVAWQYAFPVLAILAVFLLWWSRRKLGRGPLVAVLYFMLTLVPALGFVDVYPMRYSFVADHFQYLASVGLLALLSATLFLAVERLSPGARRMAIGCVPFIPIALALATWSHARAFRDEETLWRDTLARNPASWMAHNNLGLLFAGRGQQEEAAREYREALLANSRSAESEYNLGNALQAQNRPLDALSHYERAVAISPDEPKARYNLGNALAQQKRFSEACVQYAEAIRIWPGFSAAHAALGYALAQRGDAASAEEHYRRALVLDPKSLTTRYDLADLLIRQARFAEAARELQEIVRRKPDHVEARFNWGMALAKLGRLDEAIVQYEEVLRRRPDLAEARAALAEAEGLRP